MRKKSEQNVNEVTMAITSFDRTSIVHGAMFGMANDDDDDGDDDDDNSNDDHDDDDDGDDAADGIRRLTQ